MKLKISGFKVMFFFYGAMIGVPILLVLLSFSVFAGSFVNAVILNEIKAVLLLLVGIGSVVFGVIGIKQVYLHAK